MVRPESAGHLGADSRWLAQLPPRTIARGGLANHERAALGESNGSRSLTRRRPRTPFSSRSCKQGALPAALAGQPAAPAARVGCEPRTPIDLEFCPAGNNGCCLLLWRQTSAAPQVGAQIAIIPRYCCATAAQLERRRQFRWHNGRVEAALEPEMKCALL